MFVTLIGQIATQIVQFVIVIVPLLIVFESCLIGWIVLYLGHSCYLTNYLILVIHWSIWILYLSVLSLLMCLYLIQIVIGNIWYLRDVCHCLVVCVWLVPL